MRRTFLGRLLATHTVVAVAAVALLGVTLDRVFEQRAVNDLRARLIAEARTVEAVIARDGADQTYLPALGRASGTRFTVIRSDGSVLADSERDPASMANHSDRPEVRDAIAGRTGTAQRASSTLGRPFLYVALPARAGIIVRAALPADRVAGQRAAVRRAMIGASLAAALLAALFSMLIARTVARPLRDIAGEVTRVAHGDFTPIEPGGPAETRELVRAVNRMAADLAARIDEIGRETSLREQILSAMDEAVILSDGTEVVYANPAARSLFSMRDGGALPPGIPVPEGDEMIAREITLHHPTTREVRVTSLPLPGHRLLAVAHDVTEARRTDRVRRDFVADASHEMKTPVAAILATAETLETAITDDPEAAHRFAATLAREARRLTALVGDLLDLARLERPTEHDQDVDLSALARNAADEARARCEERGLSFEAEIAEGARARGSSDDFALMIRNLLDNAVRYTPTNGTVALHLATREDATTIEVRDTGIGIPSKDLPRIFERFYRVDAARSRETGGTGLGLSIVRHVAESHGGSVRAHSELGVGSIFIITLPRA
ncbi:MAG: ATP-binding protein [Actinomycetota bacterium]